MDTKTKTVAILTNTVQNMWLITASPTGGVWGSMTALTGQEAIEEANQRLGRRGALHQAGAWIQTGKGRYAYRIPA